VVPTSLAIEAVQGIVNEGNSGTTNVQFRVIRSGDTTTDVSFTTYFSGTSATAIDNADLDGMTIPHAESFTMLAGQTSMLLTLPVRGDTIMESNEAATVTIGQPVAANGVPVNITQGQANVIIRNDDGLPPVIPPGWVIGRTSGDPHLVSLDGLAYDFQAVGEFVLSESTAGSPFTVQVRTQPAPGSTVVSLTTAVATSVDGHRLSYDALSDTLRVDGAVVSVDPTVGHRMIGAGAVYQTADGTFQVVYPDGSQALIFDDRGGYLDVSLALSPGRAGQLRGLLGDFDGSTGNDMALRDGTVLTQPLAFTDLYGSFADSWRITTGESLFDYAAGQDTTNVTDLSYPHHVMTLGDFPANLVAAARAQAVAAGITDPTQQNAAVLDYLLTGDAGYFASASSPVVTTATLPVTGTPAAVPSIGIGITSPTVDERDAGTTSVTFTLYRTDGSGALDVDWAVSSMAADAADFVGGALPTGTASFAAGQTATTITVAVQGDTLAEADESFSVTISTAAAGIIVAAPQATATIQNDDGVIPATVSITALEAARAEGDAGTTTFRFAVVRSGDTSGTTSVDVVSGAAGGSSADAADLVGGFTTQTVTFNPGETNRIVSIAVQADTVHEAAETFQVSLGNATGAAIGTATAFATILNDDPVPVISIAAGPSLAEGNAGSTGFAFTLTRTGDLSAASSVQVTSSGGTADAADLVGGFATQTVAFGIGEATRQVVVQVQGDAAVEPNEVFVLTLSGPTNASIGSGTATATIVNDDAPTPPPTGGFVRLTDAADSVNYAASGSPVMVQALGGDDRVVGSAGADSINGGSGNDTLDGGAGNDVLTGGAGIDRMSGGVGNDGFVFQRTDLVIAAANGGQMDQILDFHGAGGYKAYLAVEDDMITFTGFTAGQVVFNRYVGGNSAQQIYDVLDAGLLQGNLLVQMSSGAAQLAAGDYQWR